jgi:bis(5'-nucleosidyl)-tetraphosphatase
MERTVIQKTLSSGVVVLRKEHDHYLYLLLRAYNHWDFPKGVVEPGEEPLHAAKREVEEETTIKQLDFSWQHPFIETGPYGPNKVARYYIAQTTQDKVDLPVSPTLGKPEHDEFRWVTYEEAKRLVSSRVRTVLEWANDLSKHSI